MMMHGQIIVCCFIVYRFAHFMSQIEQRCRFILNHSTKKLTLFSKWNISIFAIRPKIHILKTKTTKKLWKLMKKSLCKSVMFCGFENFLYIEWWMQMQIQLQIHISVCRIVVFYVYSPFYPLFFSFVCLSSISKNRHSPIRMNSSEMENVQFIVANLKTFRMTMIRQ